MRLMPLRTLGVLVICAVLGANCDCRSDGSETGEGNDLSAMLTGEVSIGDVRFQVWVAQANDEREKGLMFVEADQMEPTEDGAQRGMLFVFEQERNLSFYMKNTIIPLDIAFARTDGTIVKIHTMVPLDESSYWSGSSARYALEVNAGLFAEYDIEEGDQIVIPSELVSQ